MASYPISSVLDANTQTFPILTPAQIDRARPYGRVRSVHRGEILFQPGDRAVSFFVLLSGSLEIVQPGLSGERMIITHEAAGSFTGELSMISGQRCFVLARVNQYCKLNSGTFSSLGEARSQR